MSKIEVGYVFTPDGKEKRVLPGNGKKFTLEELQKHVGGYLQEIMYPRPQQGWKKMYVHEEGARLQLPVNTRTIELLDMRIYGPINGYPKDFLAVGNIVGIKSEEKK